jgi:hypothetical protein
MHSLKVTVAQDDYMTISPFLPSKDDELKIFIRKIEELGELRSFDQIKKSQKLL